MQQGHNTWKFSQQTKATINQTKRLEILENVTMHIGWMHAPTQLHMPISAQSTMCDASIANLHYNQRLHTWRSESTSLDMISFFWTGFRVTVAWRAKRKWNPGGWVLWIWSESKNMRIRLVWSIFFSVTYSIYPFVGVNCKGRNPNLKQII